MLLVFDSHLDCNANLSKSMRLNTDLVCKNAFSFFKIDSLHCCAHIIAVSRRGAS